METTTEAAFLEWATKNGMGLDARYPASRVLSYQADTKHDRFWEVPLDPETRPYFILTILSSLGNWNSCHVWRHLGRWPGRVEVDRINDQVEAVILNGIGLPIGTGDVVVFSQSEIHKLVTLIFATTIFGCSVADDLYVVPDHARQILQTDHHGVIHISFRNEGDMSRFVAKMEEKEFPLPDDIPDETFKRPKWMDAE